MTVAINGLDMALDRAGQGEPLLWLHGFFGVGSDWRHVFTDAPAGFEVIAPDLRGHGGTAHPSGEFSFRLAARDVLALLDHLGLDHVKAIGVSGGGIALLHLATLAPERVTSMVIVSAPPRFPEQARAIQRQASAEMFGEGDLALMRQRHCADGQFERLLAHARDLAAREDDVDFTAASLGTIAAETLIVFGDRDPFYPVSLACELRSAIPRSWLWVLPNAGHVPVFGPDAATFAPVALGFLRGGWRTPA